MRTNAIATKTDRKFDPTKRRSASITATPESKSSSETMVLLSVTLFVSNQLSNRELRSCLRGWVASNPLRDEKVICYSPSHPSPEHFSNSAHKVGDTLSTRYNALVIRVIDRTGKTPTPWFNLVLKTMRITKKYSYSKSTAFRSPFTSI